ncbi:uncharacterized protein LOC134213951 [Armigeres subalbatus]|uniref:uncharacterized protein LOC134213951 n=1 Tax=Armigeres subalbatus TaxID=124917 RepID=UPI002ED02393
MAVRQLMSQSLEVFFLSFSRILYPNDQNENQFRSGRSKFRCSDQQQPAAPYRPHHAHAAIDDCTACRQQKWKLIPEPSVEERSQLCFCFLCRSKLIGTTTSGTVTTWKAATSYGMACRQISSVVDACQLTCS